MPRAETLTTQAKWLCQLHTELGGKIIDNKLEVDRLRLAIQQFGAVMRLLGPDLQYPQRRVALEEI